MDKMIATCGLLCHECGAFQATQADDDKKRTEVAVLWSKQYNTELKPEDINCYGCLSRDEVVFNHPRVCEIRKCGMEKDILNCAHCSDYPCERLEKFFKMVPPSKEILDEIRSKL